MFASFAVSWAWLNYSWFASAYDTDDWVFRLATMVQMVGVIVLSLGLPQMFASLDHGDTLDNGVMVAGYVIMRVALVFLWWQVSRHDPERRPAARAYMTRSASPRSAGSRSPSAACPLGVTFAVFGALLVLELAGPFIAERKGGTPWHPTTSPSATACWSSSRSARCIIGTVAALNAVVHGEAGWSVDAALLALAGVGLIFGCWWMYFAVPWAEPLARHRERPFLFGYGHLVIFAALAAIGAGLHVAAFSLEGEATIGATATVLSVADPLRHLRRGVLRPVLAAHAHARPVPPGPDRRHGGHRRPGGRARRGRRERGRLPGRADLAPAVTVVGYETIGHRHMVDAIERL